MTTNLRLGDLFEDAQSPVVDWNGLTVYSMYELADVPSDAKMRIQFEHAITERPQALRIEVLGGEITIESETGRDFALWSDTAPEQVSATVKADAPVTLRLWNMWRNTKGVENAWMGNAGMIVEHRENAVRLRCSDGFGDATFDDLVVSLSTD